MDICEAKKLANKRDNIMENEDNKRVTNSEQENQSISFISKNTSRLIAGILLASIGILDAVILGVNIGNAEELGNAGMGTALILGGLSWFYFVGLIPLITGISLIIYYFTSIWNGKIATSPQDFTFHEQRFRKNGIYKIKKEEIDAIQYQNNLMGPKKTWVFIFVPLSIYILLYGLVLFDQPRAERITLPLMMVLSVVCMMVSLIILVLKPQKHLELASKENYYDYWFAPKNLNSESNESIENIFGFDNCKDKPDQSNLIKIEEINSKETGCITIHNWKTTFRLVLGLVLTITGLISAFGEIWFGYQFFYVTIPYGVILIIESVLSDFNSEFTFKWDKLNQRFSVGRKFKSKYHYRTFQKFTQATNQYVLKKIDIFDIISTAIMLYYGVSQIVLGWLASDLSIGMVLFDMISSSILIIAIIIYIFVYWLVPISSVSIQSGSIIHHIELPINPLLRYFKRDLNNNRNENLDKKENNQKEKTGILLRWIFLLLVIIIPLINTLLGYFVV